MTEQVKIKYYRSAIGRSSKQKRQIKALGFTKLQQERIVNWTPSMQGMVQKVIHLVKVIPLQKETAEATAPASTEVENN